MFTAYKIGISLSLATNAASILGLMSQGLRKTNDDAKALHKSLGLIGTAMAAGGFAGMSVLNKMLKPAEEYQSQLVRMNMAGMQQKDIAEGVADAWKLAGQNLSTTATGNLKMLLDLRNITGDMAEARHFLPVMAQMQTVLAASKEGAVSSHAHDLAFSAMKALDIRGAVDPARMDAQADLMTRVIIGTQGRVTPEAFQSVFNYARQAKFSMSDDFAYKILPTLMLENASKSGGGGGSRGVGPQMAALYRFTNQGFVNRKALPLLSELGWLGEGGALNTTGRGTVVGPLKDADLAASNSFEWAKKRFDGIDAYLARHKMAATEGNVLQLINEATRGNQLAGSILGEYYVKRKQFERDQKLFENVQSPKEAYRNAMSNDPATARRALSAQWENFETSLMHNIAPLVVPALMSLSKGLNELGMWARQHPDLTKNLVLGFGALAAAMAIGGTLVATTVAFTAMNTVLGGGAGLAGTLGKAGLAGAASLAIVEVGRLGFALYELWNAKNREGVKLTPDAQSRMNDPALAAFDKDFGPFDALPPGGMRATGSRPARDFVRPGGVTQPMQVTVQSMLDGRLVAESTTMYQAKALSRPGTGPRTFDGSMAPRKAGATGGF